MKTQVYLILALICCGAFAAFESDGSVTVESGDEVHWGMDGDECGVELYAADDLEGDSVGDHLYTTAAATGDCEIIGLGVDTEDQVWIAIVATFEGVALIEIAGNKVATTATDNSLVDPADAAAEAWSLIARINSEEGDDFGLIEEGYWICSVDATDNTILGDFEITDVMACDDGTILVTADAELFAPTADSVIGTVADSAFGEGEVFYVLNADDDSIEEVTEEAPDCTAIDDGTTTTTDDGEDSANILSVATALVAFLGLLAL